jgi:hypothetical protein
MFLVGPEGQQAPLCLDCNDKLSQMLDRQNYQLERLMNFFMDQADAATGIYGDLPRFPERRINLVQGGSMTFNNINVSAGNIGVLNTGNLKMVDSAITILNQNPASREVSDAITKLTSAIAQSAELPPDKKNEAIEILGTVASEAIVPKEKRRNVVVRTLLGALPTAIQTAASVMQIWQQVEPIIRAYFQT